jgi:hypothetical protein
MRQAGMAAEREVARDNIEALENVVLKASEIRRRVTLTCAQEYAVQRTHGAPEPQTANGRHTTQHVVE